MRLETNGISLDVIVEGDGLPVLLLHGFPDSARLWREQVGALKEAGFRVVAPDLRGFGESDKPEGVEAYSVLNVIEDLKGILDGLSIERAHVVGHDWGAATAWVFASIHPARTVSLTALSVGHPAAFQAAGPEQLARSWYMLMFQFEDVAEEWLSRNDWEYFRTALGRSPDVEEQIAGLSRPGALTAALNWYRANVPPHSWIDDPPPLPPITVPTMGIWSTDDFALSEDQMLGSQKYVTGPWRYERIEDVGHWIPLEAADRVNELLLDFYKREATN
jgi:pimeloyl-ACP methyl ester carboxylesterase